MMAKYRTGRHNKELIYWQPGDVPNDADHLRFVVVSGEPAEQVVEWLNLAIGEPYHIIEFAGDGFAIKHPISCRPDLFNCALNQAAVADELHHTTEKLGRFRCELVDGHVLLGEKIQ